MSSTRMEGKDGVPLRSPRPVMALIATGTAAISIALAAVPASADQVRHGEWWLGSLGITSAWSASQGSGVTVAVLSDGVVARHADLAGAVTTAGSIAGAPVATGQYLGEQGTAIASLIAGRGHGSGGANGIVGVAPKARILSVPVTLPSDDPQLGQSSVAAAIPGAIAAGIRYAVAHGATVIDLPIDPGQASSSGIAGATGAAGGSATEQAAINYALAHNVVLVAPAGDDYTAGDAPNYPAAYHGVIAVGAFDSAFNKAPFSSRQRYVTLTAAGAGVVAASSVGGYATMNSTSAASAVVAGVVALIRSRYPSLTVAQIRQVLITTTTYRRAAGLATGSGYGAVNAGQAMIAAAALGTPPSARASAGAQPLRAPAAVTATPAQQSLSKQVARAGEISGGVLVLLLLLIAIYAAVGRRRARRRTVVTAEWSHRQAQSRYPHASSTDADRMLEVFAAPAPLPASAPALARNPSQSADLVRYQRGSDGVFAPTAGRRLASAAGGSAPPGPRLAASGQAPVDGPLAISGSPTASGRAVATSGDDNWPSLGPASRAVSGRAIVSGAPPWDPAAPPAGELPWAAAGKHGSGAGRETTRPAAQSAALQPHAAQPQAAQPQAAQPQAAQPQAARSTAAQPQAARSTAGQRPAKQRPAARGRAGQRSATRGPAAQPPAAAAQGLAAAAPAAALRAMAAPPDTDYRPAPAAPESPWTAVAPTRSRPAGHRDNAYVPEAPGWDAIPPDLRRVSPAPEPPDLDSIRSNPTGAGQPGWDPSIRPSKFDPQMQTKSGSAPAAAAPQKFEWPTRFGAGARDHEASRYSTDYDLATPFDPPGPEERHPLYRPFAEPGSPGFRSPTGFGPSADAGSASAGSGAPGRHSSHGVSSTPAAPGEFHYAAPSGRRDEPDSAPGSRFASSGLPVRQPRAAWPANPAPLSPSGSLWEPVSRDAPSGPANPADSDAAGRPIFVWDPAATRDPAELDDNGAEPGWA